MNAIRERYQDREGLAKQRACIIVHSDPRYPIAGTRGQGGIR